MRSAFAFALMFFSLIALADDYPGADHCGGVVDKWCRGSSDSSGLFDSAEAACLDLNPTWHATGTVTETISSTTIRCHNGTSDTAYFARQYHTLCQYGGTFNSSNGLCENADPCPDGQERNAQGQCIVSCQSGNIVQSGYYHVGTDPNAAFHNTGCYDGCLATFSGYFPGARQVEGGVYHYYAKGDFVSTEFSCTEGASPQAQGALPGFSCGAGQGKATMGNKSVCVDEATGEPQSPYAPQESQKEIVQNPDGSTTETETGPDGSQKIIQTDPEGNQQITYTPGASGGASGSSGGAGSGNSGSGTNDGTYGKDGTGDLKQEEENGICDQYPSSAFCQEKVKIDEENVPDGTDDIFTDNKQAYDELHQEFITYITDKGWKVEQLGFTFNQAVPSAQACSFFEIHKGYGIDFCDLDDWRTIWAWAACFMAGLYIYRRTTEAVGG